MNDHAGRGPGRTHRVAAFLLLAGLATAAVAEVPRRLALTVDDLPWADHAEASAGAIEGSHRALLRALGEARVEVVGFVNPDQLEHPGIGRDRGRRMLADWLTEGHALGNHTWGHLDLHAVGATAFKAGIVAAELELRPLVEAHGRNLAWFRHPYLRTGTSAELRAAIGEFLAARGYRVAPVTVDNSDWIYALAYQRLDAEGADDARLAALRGDYVDYLMAKLRYYEQQAQDLLGAPLPQVLLLHANRLNAEAMPALLERIRADGWTFVRLEEALAHPAYARPDGYFGRFGPSWIHRWAIAEGKGRAFFGDEPRVPAEVLALAGVDSE